MLLSLSSSCICRSSLFHRNYLLSTLEAVQQQSSQHRFANAIRHKSTTPIRSRSVVSVYNDTLSYFAIRKTDQCCHSSNRCLIHYGWRNNHSFVYNSCKNNYRYFSTKVNDNTKATTVDVNNNNNKSTEEDNNSVVGYRVDIDEELAPIEYTLFHRNTALTYYIKLMRSGFIFACLHTSYWVWYTFDFIPLVNNSPMEVLHVDPILGYIGIVIAATINAAFIIYPKRLISKLTYRPQTNKIMVYTHQLPFIRQAIFPSASFPVGTLLKKNNTVATTEEKENKIKYLKLDSNSVSAKIIKNDLGDDISKYRGHIAVGQSWPKYVMDIQSNNDVTIEPTTILLEALLRPEYFDGNAIFSDEQPDNDPTAIVKRRQRKSSSSSSRSSGSKRRRFRKR